MSEKRLITNPTPGTAPAPLSAPTIEIGHSQPDVERFLDSMWSERGLSENPLAGRPKRRVDGRTARAPTRLPGLASAAGCASALHGAPAVQHPSILSPHA